MRVLDCRLGIPLVGLNVSHAPLFVFYFFVQGVCRILKMPVLLRDKEVIDGVCFRCVALKTITAIC
jgi:hypothetical protein